jgi:hypothetical protein
VFDPLGDYKGYRVTLAGIRGFKSRKLAGLETFIPIYQFIISGAEKIYLRFRQFSEKMYLDKIKTIPLYKRAHETAKIRKNR